MRVRLIQDSNANPPAASLFPDNWPIRTRVRVTPRRRGAHCKLTFHSFSLETRSRVVLLASYSCTSPAIYLEIRGSSASQALITILGGRLSLFLLLPIYYSSPFYLPRTIFIPLFPPYPLRTCWLLRRSFSTSSSLWLFAFVPVSAVGVVCVSLYIHVWRTKRKRTRVRTCAGLRRVTRASQLGKCGIISAFCHIPPTCLFPRYLVSPFLRTCLRTTLARSWARRRRRRRYRPPERSTAIPPFYAIHRSLLQIFSCQRTRSPTPPPLVSPSSSSIHVSTANGTPG